MKKLILIIALINISITFGQSFSGKGDKKLQIGGNIQNNGSGINLTYDFGLGDNMSIGLASTYLLNIEDFIDADFIDRFDIRARFNANLSSVLKIDDNFDLYPGLSLGLKNFGGHVGVRYFFSSGFGLFSELNTPFAKYKDGSLTPEEELHNQFSVSFGATFNI